MMTPEQVKDIARDTTNDVLTKLGVDVASPTEMQKDMHYLRSWRTTVAGLLQKVLMVLIGLAATGAVTVAGLGLRAYFSQ